MTEVTELADTVDIAVTINGSDYQSEIPARMLLVHFLRNEAGLTGTKIGCETSACGCCTVLLDGKAVKSCTMLAFQANGREITTIEGLSANGDLNHLQDSFSKHHAQQCGYCTAGMVMAATSLLAENPSPSRDEIKKGIAGNLCRCTGYRFIVDAIDEVAE